MRGLGISRLRVPCHAAEFAETKAERGPAGNGGGVFVHAGGQADGIGKFQAKNFRRQVPARHKFSRRSHCRRICSRLAQASWLTYEIMRAFRVLGERAADGRNFFVRPAHGLKNEK
jgi:hypothetical protein